ncbi:protein of unknown function [Moritella yayanosii]|uniref:Uncharacterized protein n=1 Tax=Moritella yayanosii TaxID=69539 RepID=A0A330LLJ9_9GAMM|nr:protein of unknown function [Moritella yayanosii]
MISSNIITVIIRPLKLDKKFTWVHPFYKLIREWILALHSDNTIAITLLLAYRL